MIFKRHLKVIRKVYKRRRRGEGGGGTMGEGRGRVRY